VEKSGKEAHEPTPSAIAHLLLTESFRKDENPNRRRSAEC